MWLDCSDQNKSEDVGFEFCLNLELPTGGYLSPLSYVLSGYKNNPNLVPEALLNPSLPVLEVMLKILVMLVKKEVVIGKLKRIAMYL